MEIIYDETQIDQDLIRVFERAAEICLKEEGIPSEHTEISLIFVTSSEIKQINLEYRGNDSVTDVLSFPQYEREELDKMAENVGFALLLGDIVICQHKAEEQAEEFSHSKERELVYLFVHSVFHLLGYDHLKEEERTVMREKEEKVMNVLGLERGGQI